MTLIAICNAVPAYQFPDIYEELLWKILHRGVEEVNERTGHIVKVLPWGPTSFAIDLEEGILPIAGNRKLFPGTAAAELAWMLMGTQDAAFMLKHAKVVWEKFLEDELDWQMDRTGRQIIKAAYGYRWRTHFKRDQLRLAIDALQKNPTDRRIWVSAWDPAEDGLGRTDQINVPCPVGFTLSIVDGKLCSAYLLRSSDVFVGLPYDIMGHAMLMQAIAVELGLGLGVMHFTLAHPHLYDSHFDEALESFRHKRKLRIPLDFGWDINDIVEKPDGFVEMVRATAKVAPWQDFCPRPDVIP